MKRCLWAGMLGLLVGVAPTWATYTAVDNTQDGEFGGELTHAELLEDVYSPDVAWSAWSSGALQGYTNGWLWAIRVDDTDVSFNDKTWPAARYEVRSVARYSGHSTAWYGYDVGSGFVESLTMDYGGGWGKPGFCVVDVASGTLEWNLKRHDTTVLSSNSATDNLVTYVITPDPTIDLEDDADHWLLCWEEYLASGNDDYNDAVWDVRKAPEPSNQVTFLPYLTPLGNAVANESIVQMVRVWLSDTSVTDAVDAADAACAATSQYAARGTNYDSNRIAIFIQGFGSGDGCTSSTRPALVRHADDAVTNATYSTDICSSPWDDEGVDECGDWMTSFLDQYSSSGPTPYRFHFDMETDPLPSGDVWIWEDIKNDTRFNTITMRGFAKTLAALHTDSGSLEPCDHTLEFFRTCNRTWGEWYAGVNSQATDAAMKAAAYDNIRNEYPSCLSSNYGTSGRYDGADGRIKPNAYGFEVSFRGVGDLQAPSLYPIPVNVNPEAGETRDDAWMRFSRADLRGCLYSFGGCAPSTITPWIALPNSLAGRTTRDGTGRLLSLLRSKGVEEMILYTESDYSVVVNWNTFDMLVDHIWGASLASTSPVTINEGTGRQADAALLEYALNEFYVVESDTVGTDEVAEFDVTFETDFDYPVRDLRVYLETTALDYWGGYEDVTAYVSVYNTGTLSFDAAGNVTIPCSGGVYERQEVYFDLDNAADYFDASADVVVRVRYESDGAFLSMTDLVQIVGANEKEVIYVDSGATGADDGTSWTNAYDDLQDALDYAADNVTDSMEIWVAAGTYTPGALATDTFELVDGVRVFGGFDGAETTLAERDVATNVTILSGDLGSSVYSQHVVKIIDCGADTLLDGFTVTDGVATGLYPGGGLYITGGAPVVSNCIITGNSSANVGGGVYLNDADAAFVDCTITTNTATNGGGGLYSTTGDISLTDCVIIDNTATSTGGGAYFSDSPATISGCLFDGNSAASAGGLYAVTAALTASDTVFDGNAATYGAGAYIAGGGAFVNCLFHDNDASDTGGALLALFQAVSVVGCTVADNDATTLAGGVYYYSTSNSMTVTNSIIYGNTAGSSPQIEEAYGTIAVTYSDIENATVWPGAGNDSSDPLFTDDTNGDYTLTSNSPCIDAGYNTNVPEGCVTDLAGEDRIVDGDADSTDTVDMGCYEYQPS